MRTLPAIDAIDGSLDEYDHVPGELDAGGLRIKVFVDVGENGCAIAGHALTVGAVPVIVTFIVTVILA